jgi:HEAT repeat protein
MTCSTCGTTLDLRARIVRVRESSVVAFCSAACLDGPPKPQPEPTVPTSAPLTIPVAPPPAPAAVRRRRPPLFRVAADFIGATVAVALLGVLVRTVPSRPEPAEAVAIAGVIPAAPEPSVPPKPPLGARARAVLDRFFVDADPDLAFQAALALARIGDDPAARALRRIVDDPRDPRWPRAAALLAAGGDATALAALRKRLSGRRREERLLAARTLALAGDASGRDLLRPLLGSRRTRLGAAEALAALRDEPALAALRRELRSEDVESRMRAAVALGRLGDPSAGDELRRVIGDGRYQIGAAVALSYLDDAGARPALVESLRHSALRVEAALALARLRMPPPEALREALDEEPPAGRIQAALAILLLAPGEAR